MAGRSLRRVDAVTAGGIMADVAAQLSDLEWPVRTSRLLLRQAEERDEDSDLVVPARRGDRSLVVFLAG